MRKWLLFLLLSVHLFSQPPAERVNNGFKTLGTGAWSDAFLEWEKQALPSFRSSPDVRQTLEDWVPKTWGIGNWEPFQVLAISQTWQRQLWLASFDHGVVFFAFDFVLHKGEWRLFNLQVSKDPRTIAPNLDLYPAMASRLRE